MDDGSGTASAGWVRHGGILAVGNGGDHRHRVKRASTVRQAVCAFGTGKPHSRDRGPTAAASVRCLRVSAHRGALGVRRWDQRCMPKLRAIRALSAGRSCLIEPASPGSGSARRGWPVETAACRAEGPTAGWRSARSTSVPGATCGGLGNAAGCRPGRARGRGRQRRAGKPQLARHIPNGRSTRAAMTQMVGDTVRGPHASCAAGRGAGAVSGIGRVRSGLVTQGGRSVGSQARLCG